MIIYGILNNIFVVFTNLLYKVKLKTRYMRNQQYSGRVISGWTALGVINGYAMCRYDTTDVSFSDKVFG